VHRCLHRALAQAVTWRLVTHNAATHATPPPVPHHRVVALAPEQVAVLLDAADQAPSPWLGSWTVLAAATGARNGELCGLQWADLDLDAGTVRFRQALTIVDPAVLPAAAGDGGVGGRRKELAVGRWSPLPAARSSPCQRSPSRRCAVTAASSSGCAWRWGSPPRWRCARWSPAGHPARSSWTWCSAPSAAPRSAPTTPAAPSPGWPPASGRPLTRTCCATRWRRRWRQQGTGQHHRRAAAPRRRRRPRTARLHPPTRPDRAPAGRAGRGRVRPGGAGHPGGADGVGGASGGGNRSETGASNPA
jgi:hypothetical protein